MTTLKKIILHIGQTKTATTSLQFFLAWNKKHLQSKGITYLDYPNVGRQISHRYLFNFLMLNNARQEEEKERHRQRLQEMFSGSAAGMRETAEEFFINSLNDCSTETGLISEELFWHLGMFEREMRISCLGNLKNKILEAAPGVRFRVIIYLRPQDSWLESWHNQLVKDSYMQGSIRQMYLRHVQLDALHYVRIIDDWMNILEPAEVVIRPFIRNEMLNGSIFDDFLMYGLGVTPSPEYTSPRKKLQESLHPSVCAYVIRNRPAISAGYKKALQQMSDYARQYRSFRNIAYTLIKEEERMEMQHAVSGGNTALTERFGLACDLNTFFTWHKTPVPMPLPRRIRRKFRKTLDSLSAG